MPDLPVPTCNAATANLAGQLQAYPSERVLALDGGRRIRPPTRAARVATRACGSRPGRRLAVMQTPRPCSRAATNLLRSPLPTASVMVTVKGDS